MSAVIGSFDGMIEERAKKERFSGRKYGLAHHHKLGAGSRDDAAAACTKRKASSCVQILIRHERTYFLLRTKETLILKRPFVDPFGIPESPCVASQSKILYTTPYDVAVLLAVIDPGPSGLHTAILYTAHLLALSEQISKLRARLLLPSSQKKNGRSDIWVG